ncbi:uncharacterized protein LOC116841604 [Odontomachus brunneus]|uniref:uncharacterized protein LOC116841604 n=1 Tax=Odontomachus brunneus TaxID=486640 RepID=UPI0013F1FCCF|nr:uncharacterized protein LOC116841604 [Odontomachus brunneus]XP_032665623.1 uncharacterized protein LOC116841604 [Odontomachus brunneus]XP_032665624.1 uncharacterized protein LOC116841604 [Odontomachus brunneus]
MGFNPMKWKTRTVVYGVLGTLLFYILFVYKKKYQVIHEIVVNNSNPKHVWEFVADFSNMKKLNPTIEDFSVIAESGNYDHWKYTVRYTEHLSHLPIIRNVAYGQYAVRPDNDGYVISSKHRTCFFLDLGCLESVSKFRFDVDGEKDTKCIETVQYECPIALSFLCYMEVMYQRKEIMKRLKWEFAMTDIKVN